MSLKKVVYLIFATVLLFLLVGCSMQISNNNELQKKNHEYVLDAKTCKTFLGCDPKEAALTLKDSYWVEGHFQSAKEDERGNLVLVLSDDDVEHWKSYINKLFEEKQRAEEADGFKFLVQNDYKCIETYVNEEIYTAAGFNLTFMSVYCGIMQMLNDEDPNEWYVDLKMCDVETGILIKEARFPDESLSVTDEDWEKALYSTVEAKQYTVVDTVLDIRIDYPYFEEESQQVNSLIESFIINTFKKDFSYTLENLEEDEKLTVEIDYEIENYDNELLSVLFTGCSYVSHAAYPKSLCYAVTINLENESIVTWESYYKDASEILNLLGDGKYQVLYGGLELSTEEEVCKKFEPELQKGIESNDLYFYIKDGETYFVITTLIHAMGDYSIVLIESQS